jgi:hypothetical protein
MLESKTFYSEHYGCIVEARPKNANHLILGENGKYPALYSYAPHAATIFKYQ